MPRRRIRPCQYGCGARVARNARTCPSCGGRRPYKKPPSPLGASVVIGGLLVCIGTLAIPRGSDEAAKTARQRDLRQTPRSQAELPSPGVDQEPVRPTTPYEVLSVDRIPGIKLALDVRLGRAVEEAELQKLAEYLHQEHGGHRHKRTFICYVLPGMKAGAGAWATTHFDPSLEVEILGFTPAEEETLPQAPADPDVEVIGKWIDRSPIVGGQLTLVRDGKKLIMRRTFKDGSQMERPLGALHVGSEERLMIDDNDFGKYYVVDPAGNLRICDRDGEIARASKLEH